MALFNIVNVESIFSIGPSGQVAVFHLGGQQSGKPGNLEVPWHDAQPLTNPTSLLSWHTRISTFSGREQEIEELKQWAYSEQAVSIKFITGEGGTGKSRLAAEFATMLQHEGWSAGFLDLKKPQSFSMKKTGTLLIIDYPEEERKNVSDFLHDLSTVSNKNRLKVLFLTRQAIDPWSELIYDAKAGDLLDRIPIILKRLEPQPAHQLFTSALIKASKNCNTTPLGLSEEALTDWLNSAPENQRALFILAAAIYNATNPDDDLVQYTGRQVVESLCDRELIRLRAIAENNSLEDKYSIPRVLALSAFKDKLTTQDINAFDEETIALFGFPPKTKISKIVKDAGLIVNDIVLTPKPDILTSAFVSIVLGENTEKAPEILWLGIQSDITGGLERLARLSYDAEIVLGLLTNRISMFLPNALKDKIERCKLLDDIFSGSNLPLGWVETAISVWQVLLKNETNEVVRARLFNNLSNSLSDSGNIPDALKAIQEAVDIYRRLAQWNPDRFEPDLAMSLNNLSSRLSNSGNFPGALKAIQEAVDIRRRLAQSNPERFEPVLANSLNNLSNGLSNSGNIPGSLQAIQESVDIHRRLAQINPDRFEPDLAGSLNNLSNRLSNSGNIPDALQAIQESVDIYRRLAQANPDRFEPDLAMSLNNLSNRLSDSGDIPGALIVIREAVDSYGRLVQANPARFEPDLANSYGAYGLILHSAGKKKEACKVLNMGLTLIQPYAKQFPDSRFGKIQKGLEQDLKDAGCTELKT